MYVGLFYEHQSNRLLEEMCYEEAVKVSQGQGEKTFLTPSQTGQQGEGEETVLGGKPSNGVWGNTPLSL